MIPLGDDGLAKVTESLLSLRFRFHLASIHVEEEVFDANGDLSHTVLQISFRNEDGRVWFTTRKNMSILAEFQHNYVDVMSWFGTLDSDNF
jgi:hypothetical protein